jgi:hypothetical protein
MTRRPRRNHRPAFKAKVAVASRCVNRDTMTPRPTQEFYDAAAIICAMHCHSFEENKIAKNYL